MNIEQARKWMQDAINDGWEARATYNSEPIEQACSLSNDTFKASIIARPKTERFIGDVSVSVWTKDDIAVEVGDVYDLEELVRNINKCDSCKQYVEKTVRVGFANRMCPPCREKNVDRFEYRGWAE